MIIFIFIISLQIVSLSLSLEEQKEDYSIIAQGIVRGTESNLQKECFHSHSFIYKKTNEQLEYVTEYFKDKKRILCVIGSGDQILNALTFVPEKIVGFDISVFPKFFLKLKLAGIMNLSRDEFGKFFFDVIYNSNEDFYDDMFFFKIFPHLDEESKNFWGFLFEYNEWYDIYISPLFSSEVVSVNRALEQNEYLKEDKYSELKEIIPKVKIDFIVADIINARIENLSHKTSYREAFDYVTARALGNLSLITELALPFLKLNGKFIAYKAAKLFFEKSGIRFYSFIALFEIVFNNAVNFIDKHAYENLENRHFPFADACTLNRFIWHFIMKVKLSLVVCMFIIMQLKTQMTLIQDMVIQHQVL